MLAFIPTVMAACCAVSVSAAPGVTGDTVTFGQSGCFTGTCATAGLQYRAGILTAFHERNREGGVNGRELKLVSRDDGYEPELAAANADWFAATSEVFAVIGGIGTPTARRIAPALRRAKMPFVGHYTGADFLSDARRYPNVVNVRTVYAEEVRRLVVHMFEELGARRFGIIFQDDAFGRSVLASYESALEAFDLPILAKASYSRHTHAVHASVFIMEKADLDAVMLATTTGPAADAINTARSLGHDYTVGLLSFVESERLRVLLDHPYERILLTRVTPDATDNRIALVRQFHRALAAYRNAEPEASERVADSGALEGYILGRFVIDVLERMPDEPTREAFLATALNPEPVVIDEWVIAFEEGANVGSDYVRLIDLSGYDSTKEAAE
jgi:ABC-type branched-subunit amino acid transport system substrate-binding protein